MLYFVRVTTVAVLVLMVLVRRIGCFNNVTLNDISVI